MPAPYTELQGNETSSLLNIFDYASNTASGGMFMPLALASIWIVLFIGSLVEGRQASRAFIFSSFICSILGMLLAFVGLVASQYMYFMFLLVGVGVIWYKLDNAPGI